MQASKGHNVIVEEHGQGGITIVKKTKIMGNMV